ncbi:MAG: hypothetical protein PEPC_00681 [Peptostreptococcus russellii]
MPKLGEFYSKLEKDIGFFTICQNSEVGDKTLKNIFNEANFHPITLVDGDGDFQTVFDHLVYAPAILLLDSSGNLKGELLLRGSDNSPENYYDFIEIARSFIDK